MINISPFVKIVSIIVIGIIKPKDFLSLNLDFSFKSKYEKDPKINSATIFWLHIPIGILLKYIATAPMTTDGNAMINGTKFLNFKLFSSFLY